MLVLTNLVANGHAKVVPVLPPVNHDFNAPWPRLSKWGFTEGNYKTVHMNRERLQFGMELHATDSYVHGIPIERAAPPLSYQVEGELGARLPIWVDINGNLMQDIWNMTLVATFYILTFRPGITIDALCRAYEGKVWTWELELFLQWAETAGLARKIEDGDETGWTTSEWWWLALAE